MTRTTTVLPQARAAALSTARDQKMAASPAAFVRGSTSRYYDWLKGLEGRSLPEGPAVWICGDCHLGNLGPVANAGGKIQIEIRDFDQTVIGNPVHDLIRLGLSMASAARSSDLAGVVTAKIVEGMIECYEKAFDSDFDEERDLQQPKTIRDIDRQAKKSTWRTLAVQNIEDERPTIPLGHRFWPITKNERKEIVALSESKEVQELATILSARDDSAHVEIVDAAFWKKGCSSLGLLRYAVLLRVGSKGDNRLHCLMDIKEAARAAAPRASRAGMPSNQAERIVTGAGHMSPFLGERMRAIELMGKKVFVREILPQDLKIEVGQVDSSEAKKLAGFLAGVVGKAHGLQMDTATRKQWRRELRRNRSKSLDAPTWLWRNVVELLADHERAYLEHCRKYAPQL